MEESSPTHEDRESIPQVLEIIKSLGKETEPGVESAKQKVELWRYNSNLVFKAGEVIVRTVHLPFVCFLPLEGYGSPRRTPFVDPYRQTSSST